MVRYFIQRILQAIIVLFLVTVIVFLTLQAMPGDPVSLYLGANASNEQIAYYTEKYGFDQPIPVQYLKWITGILQGDMGESIVFQKPINEILRERVPITLSITLPALILAALFGIAFGVIAAVKRGTAIDSFITSFANIGVATPNFWLALLGMFIFGLKLKLLPIAGYVPLSENLSEGFRKLILPVLVLSLGPLVSFTRQTRSAVLEVIKQDFVRTARSKGLKEKVVIAKHVLKNSFIPILTLMGMMIGGLLGGTVVIEQIFNIPGIGMTMIRAITNKDFLVVQNIVFVIAVIIQLSNLVVDFLYGIIDPRIRIAR